MSASDVGLEVAAVGARYGLAKEQVARLVVLVGLLAAAPDAPTAVRDPREIVDAHVADSLTALEIDGVSTSGHLVDIGAGAGLPGLVLAVALPDCRVSLIESQERKCAFLRSSIEAMGLGNATAIRTRAEAWVAGADTQDLAVARAVGPQAVVLEYAAPLLRVGGRLVDWRGVRSPGEESQADRAAAELGLLRREVRHVAPFPAARDHHLHTFEKVSATPARFPRRVGVARKRPLGA